MAEPRYLEVNKEKKFETVSGGQGLSSANVGTEAKEQIKNEEAVQTVKGEFSSGEIVVEKKVLGKQQKFAGRNEGQRVAQLGREYGTLDPKGNIVNTITVDEVKRLIKEFGGSSSGDLSNYYTKAQVDYIVETLKKNAFIAVNITTYPTLEDFLESEGEEGYIYLYPVDTSESPTFESGYYEYVWESNVWLPFGSTKLDLSPYAKLSIIAPNYDATSTYVVGAKVIYNAKLYTCSTAITQAEEWNSSHWTEINISSGFVDLDSAQTITGIKTILGTYLALKHSANGHALTIEADSDLRAIVKMNNVELFRMVAQYGTAFSVALNPQTDNNIDLGKIGNSWKDLYLSGKIKDGTNEFNADNVFNVINASDIVDNTLTQAQYDLITNGKPTLIKGTLKGYKDMFICSCKLDGSTTYGSFLGVDSSLNTTYFRGFSISSSKVINILNNSVAIKSSNQTILFNGKALPAYPTTNTDKQYLSIAANGGALSWDDPFNPTSVSLSDGGTISDTTLQTNIQSHRPIVLNGFTCYFSCDDGTNYQYTSMRYDANANKNHINVITINKSTWEAIFHTSDLTLN